LPAVAELPLVRRIHNVASRVLTLLPMRSRTARNSSGGRFLKVDRPLRRAMLNKCGFANIRAGIAAAHGRDKVELDVRKIDNRFRTPPAEVVAQASAVWLRFEFSTQTNKMRFTPLVISAKRDRRFKNATACSTSGKAMRRGRGRAHWETKPAAPDAPSDFLVACRR